MKAIAKKIFSIALSAALLFAALLPLCLPRSGRAAAATEPIKVGFFAFSGYHIEDENGRRSGYGYDFLQLLARHTGFEYEYIGYDKSHNEVQDMLLSGEVDLVTSLSKTPEREAKFAFSAHEIGQAYTIFTVKAGNTSVQKGEYGTYDGLKIGMLEGNAETKNKTFADFARDNGFTYTTRLYSNETELTAALQSGEVDGIVTGSLRALENERLIEDAIGESQPFYVCMRKGDERMAQVDAAIEEMNKQEPNWQRTLQDKYYSTDQSGNVVLTQEERAYLRELNTGGTALKVLMNPDRRPYSYFENGEPCGIFPALFEKIVAGLPATLTPTFEYIQPADRADYAAKRTAKEADIVIDFGDDFSIAEQDGYKITDSYFSSTHTLIKRRDHTGPIGSMGAIYYADNAYSHYLADYVGPNVEVKRYNTLEESFQAVLSGECDATIALSYVAEICIWEDTRNELTSELIDYASTNYTLGVRSGGNGQLLLSALNKCVASFDRGSATSIISAEVTKFRPDTDTSVLAFLRRNPVYIVLIVVSVCLLLFVAAMLIARTVNQRKLQQRIAKATAQLEAQKEELSKALHAADAANRSKTTFLNNMSHDIRTPMNAIIGFTALATTHLDNKERALDYLAKISQASNHLLSLINDVLDMSRIESGKVHIEERPENLADILQGLRNIIQSDIHAKNMELFIDTVDVVNEEVFCDKLRLNQILLNLTSNAIKFTPSGGTVAIRITQKPCEKAGYGVYEFSVRDTGIGMSPDFVDTVFDPFTRERNSTVSGIQGTGLGMAITKNIVDIMGGKIGVVSEQGKGSEFTVTLELRFADTEKQNDYSLAELRGLYALVVDDDLISCQSVAKMLRQIGMHAEWTLTGKEAVVRTSEAIELEHPFEVYIIDWSMPDMDGISTVRQIRAIIGDDSPIILMSAYDWADIEQDARDAGVTGFISKPLFASDLHRTLERSLGKVHAERTAPEEPQHAFVGKRILLAEDNELNREIAEELLSEAGLQVESAENGAVAVDMLKNAPDGYYDLVLMDVQMPIMNGYDATRAIRALENKAKAEIPVIAMTANAFVEDKENAFAAGMNGHLAKPIDIDAMLAMLDNVLSEK